MAIMPPGSLISFAAKHNQDYMEGLGWLLCNGDWYPVSKYPLLDEVLDGDYGREGRGKVAGFFVPDFRGQFTGAR